MMGASGTGRAPLLVLGLMVWLSGCAAARLPPSVPDDVAPVRQTRKVKAIRDFEAGRERAEYEAALDCFDRGDFRGSRQLLETLLKSNPDHRDGLLLLCEVCLAAGQPAEALLHANRLIRQYPEDPAVQQRLSAARAALGRPEAALSGYPTPMASGGPIEPENPSVTRLAGYAEDADRRDRGADADPIDPAAADTLQRVRAALERGDDVSALDHARCAMAGAAGDPRVGVSAATSALRVNRPDIAETMVREALQGSPQSAALYRLLGLASYRCGDYTSSQVALRQALLLDNSSALSYFLMGCTLAKLGQPELAGTCFAQARRIDPRFATERSRQDKAPCAR